MLEDKTAGFGKWRSFFWPIHRWELKKFLPLFGMFSLITFNYNLLRAYKDSMIVTAKHSGAETIPFIKVWVILPAAFLITYIFTRLCNRFSKEKVFYIMMSIFLAFFFIFTFFLYPAQDFLHPNAFADKLQAMLPEGCKGFVALFRNWTFTLFYVISELWSTAILTVLFWGFANEVTSVGEARRFYGFLTVGGNLTGIFAGLAAGFFANQIFLTWLPYGKTSWDQAVLFLNCTIILSGFLTMALFRWMNQTVLKPAESEGKPQEKIKMSMRKNFAYLMRSKYLLCIAAIVVAYHLAMNLVEVIWKNQIKEAYPDPTSYTSYMGEVLTVMGVIATIIAVFFTSSFIRKSWTIAALVPALMLLLTGFAFFFFTLSEGWGRQLASFFSSTPLMLSIFFGSLHQVMARATKYTLFDATKEVAFVPLSSESRLKGKAAIDGVGSRLGKSGGSIIYQGLILLLTTVTASVPYVGAIFLIVILVWIYAIVALGKKFDALTSRKPKLEIGEVESELMKEGA